MNKAHLILTTFNAGELSPLLDGRTDVAKYYNGCRLLNNFITSVQGPARRRSGTMFSKATKTAADRAWLARFLFATDEAYILEFGDHYIRFYTNQAYLSCGSPSAWSDATAYVCGDIVADGGVNYWAIKAGTHQHPNASPTYWHPMTSDVFEIYTPYHLADLITQPGGSDTGTFNLSFCQSADVLYVFNRLGTYPTYKLSRLGATQWTWSEASFVGGPFEEVNDTATTVYASAQAGSVTLTASASIFAATDVGGLFYLRQKTVLSLKQWETAKAITDGDLRRNDGKTYEALNTATTGLQPPVHTEGAEYDGSAGVQWLYSDPGYGVCLITAYSSGTAVTATVLDTLPFDAVGSGSASTQWAHGSFSATRGYPTAGAFYGDRLVLAKDISVYLSVVGDYENFAARDKSGDVVADQAINATISSGQVNVVNWIVAGDEIFIGTNGNPFVIGPSDGTQALSPSNIRCSEKPSFKSSAIPGIFIGEEVIYVPASGRSLRSIRYEFSSDAYVTKDLTVLASHVAGGADTRIIGMTYVTEPEPIIWCVRADGQLLGLTYNKEQDVIGWHRHKIGGTYGSVPWGIVECVESIPSNDGDRDELWMIVKRTVNGSTVRYIEYLSSQIAVGEDVTAAGVVFTDSSVYYDPAIETHTIPVAHLEGELVRIMNSGEYVGDATVVSGEVGVADNIFVSESYAGLSCPCELETMQLNAPSNAGTSQGKKKRVINATVRLYDSLGGYLGHNSAEYDALAYDDMVNLFTGDKRLSWNGGYEDQSRVYFRSNSPLPVTICAIIAEVEVED